LNFFASFFGSSQKRKWGFRGKAPIYNQNHFEKHQSSYDYYQNLYVDKYQYKYQISSLIPFYNTRMRPTLAGEPKNK
jgi:hypothetical protein